MPTVTELAAFLFLGLAGSVHCAGMCGAFAACASACPSRPQSLKAFAAYGLGKTSTYVTLALAASLGVEHLTANLDSGTLSLARRGLALLAGLAFIATGASMAGWLPTSRIANRAPRPVANVYGLVVTQLRNLLGTLRTLPPMTGALGTGVLTGLLPCGLTLSMLALAAQSHRPGAVLGASLFGLATLPALGLVAVGSRWLPIPWRARAARLAGPALVIAGCVTLVRGAPPGSNPLCEHCHTAPASESRLQPAAAPLNLVIHEAPPAAPQPTDAK